MVETKPTARCMTLARRSRAPNQARDDHRHSLPNATASRNSKRGHPRGRGLTLDYRPASEGAAV